MAVGATIRPDAAVATLSRTRAETQAANRQAPEKPEPPFGGQRGEGQDNGGRIIKGGGGIRMMGIRIMGNLVPIGTKNGLSGYGPSPHVSPLISILMGMN